MCKKIRRADYSTILKPTARPHGVRGEDMEIVATDWMREVFEPTVRAIPSEYRYQIEPAPVLP